MVLIQFILFYFIKVRLSKLRQVKIVLNCCFWYVKTLSMLARSVEITGRWPGGSHYSRAYFTSTAHHAGLAIPLQPPSFFCLFRRKWLGAIPVLRGGTGYDAGGERDINKGEGT